jgi:hypothetical protein
MRKVIQFKPFFRPFEVSTEGFYARYEYILAVDILSKRFKFWVAGPCTSFGVHNMSIGLI